MCQMFGMRHTEICVWMGESGRSWWKFIDTFILWRLWKACMILMSINVTAGYYEWAREWVRVCVLCASFLCRLDAHKFLPLHFFFVTLIFFCLYIYSLLFAYSSLFSSALHPVNHPGIAPGIYPYCIYTVNWYIHIHSQNHWGECVQNLCDCDFSSGSHDVSLALTCTPPIGKCGKTKENNSAKMHARTQLTTFDVWRVRGKETHKSTTQHHNEQKQIQKLLIHNTHTHTNMNTDV